MIRPEDGLYAALIRRGLSRRAFLKFSTALAATLALPATYAPRIALAIETAPRLPVIWLRGQACGGETAAFLSATKPTAAELVLGLLSIEYHETLMGAAGATATLARTSVSKRYPNGYLAVVEGSVPTAEEGMACTIGGRPFRDVVREVSGGALATIALGACAFDGGAAAASHGTTGAVGVGDVIDRARLINLPGCPVNVENLAATIVNYLTFKEFPVTDAQRRPLFAYGGLLHNQCERRGHFEFGEFALAWGDEGAQKGWCLYKLGCKGPETFANCATALYAGGTSWNVKAGHGCIGCTMPRFWDAMGPAYARLPSPLPFAANITTDQVGLALVGGVAGVTAVHGALTYARELRNRAMSHRRVLATEPLAEATAEPLAEPTTESTADLPESPPPPPATPPETEEA